MKSIGKQNSVLKGLTKDRNIKNLALQNDFNPLTTHATENVKKKLEQSKIKGTRSFIGRM